MARRIPLPDGLDGPFRVSDALDRGVGAGRLRGRDLGRPHHGARVTADADLDDLQQSCAAYRPLLRSNHFSQLTAARLWGCPLPRAFDRGEPLHVTAVHPGRAPRGRAIVGHQVRSADPVLRFGMLVSDPLQTWLSLAPLLDLDDLVACGDHLVLDPPVLDPSDPRPHLSLAHLQSAAAQFRGRGARAAARAASLVRDGAESRPETLLRLLLGRAGLPEPELNVDVYGPTGRWIARVDILFRQWGVVVEYDGDGHRASRAQYERDITRVEDIAHSGLTVVRVRSRGLFSAPASTVERVARALRTRGWPG